MAFIKRLSENITTKRKTSTDIQPTGLLGNNLVTNAMLQPLSVTPDKLSFATSLNTNYGLAASVASNALTISLLTSTGAVPSSGSPVRLTFRSNTLTLGNMDQISAAAAVTLTVPAGATLGGASNVAFQVNVYAINNAGTIQLAVQGSDTQQTQGLPVITALSGTSNSGTTLYAASAFAGGLPTIWLGRFTITNTTAGQWSVAPTSVVLSINNNRFDLITFGTATSSVKTPTATGNYGLMTNNSVTLVPGVWDVYTTALFTDSGTTATYTNCTVNTFDANGADSAVAPTALGGLGTITVMSANQSGITFNSAAGGTVHAHPVRIQVNSTSTIYAVPFASMTTAANARITTFINASRVR